MMVKYFESDFTAVKTGFPAGTPYAYSYPCEKGTYQANDNRFGSTKLIADPAYGDTSKLCMEMKLLGANAGADQSAKLSEEQNLEPTNYAGDWANNKQGWWNFDVWIPGDFAVKGWRMLWQNIGTLPTPSSTSGPQMAIYCYSSLGFTFEIKKWATKSGAIRQYPFLPTANFPRDQWVPVSIFVKQGSGFKTQDGTVQIRVKGAQLFNRVDLETGTATGSPYVAWSICNYGGGAELAGQRILYRNVNVSDQPTPTPPPIDPCQTYKDQVAALTTQLQAATDQVTLLINDKQLLQTTVNTLSLKIQSAKIDAQKTLTDLQ